MKQKQRIALFGMAAVALILAACDGDSGNNSSESEGDSSSSVEISSSSEQINLSSVVKSSSSSLLTESSSSVETCTNTYGTNTVKDCRDNQTYKTVVIGTQTWMAENLNYAMDGSLCYDNAASNCTLYGRLYTWAVVMGVASTYNSAILGDSVNHQGICPDGWHVPRSSEWTTLENYVGGSSTAGTYLKATSGWTSYSGISNSDSYGFSALPGGYYHGSDFYGVGNLGDWWTATEFSSTDACHRDMSYGYTGVYAGNRNKTYGRSLRCLKD